MTDTIDLPASTRPSYDDGDIWLDPDDPSVLWMRGEVDLLTVHRFCDRLHPGAGTVAVGRVLVDAGVRTLDARAVTFADSHALDLVLALASHLYPARLRLRGRRGPLVPLLEVTRTEPYVELRD